MTVKLNAEISLWTYFKKYRSSQTEDEPNNLLLRYQGQTSNKVPTDVDSYKNSYDGTYHPDNLTPILSWTGGDYVPDRLISGDYNPFNCQFNPLIKKAQNEYFTEELPPQASNLQWALFISEGYTAPDTTRGNRGPAKLDEKPDGWNKPQFLAYTSMRSYPHMQLRYVVAALKADSLPLDCPEVLILFEQTLYHIGSISYQQEPALSWKRDGCELFSLMEQELRRLVEQLRESPKSHKALHLLSIIAVFVGQHLASCRELTRSISAIALRWTEEIEQEIEAIARETMNTDPRHIYEQRAKQFIFYSYSLLCYRCSELTSGDAERIVRLAVLARNVRVFEDETRYKKEVEAFSIEVERAMSGLASKLHVAITSTDFSRVLTAAVGVVIASLPALQWIAVPNTLCCFEATDSSGLGSSPRLLSLNAVSGVVLCDGMPPRRLPKSVTSDEMYVRSFSTRDFEVTMSANVYTSSRPLAGCIYQFIPPRDGTELVVTERHVDSGVELQLLQGGASGVWKEDLPISLHKLHSHWYCASLNSIVLRPISFYERSISYLITGDLFGSSVVDKCQCFIIPPNYQNQSALMLLQLINDEPQRFRRLILHSPHLVTAIMCRVEHREFIHTQLTHEENIIIHLTRFDLSFSVGSDGVVNSEDYEGYHLAHTQQIKGTLRNFTGYLVLHNANSDVRVVIPVGKVIFEKASDRVHIERDKECGKKRRCHVYSYNPRLHILQGSDIAAQLHLAALYAATATSLPEPLTGRTGDESAIRIVRECFINRPLTPEEDFHLRNITHFCNRSPVLILLCHYLSASSMHLSALHSGKVTQLIPLDTLAATEYLQSSRTAFKSRIRLLPEEEKRLLGKTIHTPSAHKNGGYGQTDYDACKVTKNNKELVTQIEDELYSLVDEHSPGLPQPPFPLRPGDSQIGVKIREDLSVSWGVHQALPTKVLSKHTRQNILGDVQRHRIIVVNERERIETHLLKAIDSVSGCGPEVTVFRILKSTHAVASMNVQDMMRIALSAESVLVFNPFYSRNACARIRADVLLWLQLCVLEDKLHRIIQFASKQGGDDLLIQELQTRRIWSVEEHPYWLVYEAINTIQIRPTQFSVAKSLMDNEGAIVQLNMGEGKTRVILPMLILYWGSAAQRRESVVRLHFLRQLIEEGFAFLHGQLSRSVLQIKLFLMPFHRGIKLDVPTVRRMHEHVLMCQMSGGCMVLAREHRQSLQLKTNELKLLSPETSGDIVAELNLMKKRKYLDMLDESDELLHYRDELVYAVGEAEQLPGASSRWAAAEAVLLALKHDHEVQSILHSSNLHVRDTAGHEDASETFPKIRLLVGQELERAVQPLQLAIAEYVMNNPPYAMCWMKRIPATDREKMIQYMCNPALKDKCRKHAAWRDHEDDLLALRGLLSYSILFYCLQLRHSVNYGVNRVDGKKRSAVPFKASGVPSGQSEFAHPDITIVLTMFSYFSDGLSEKQLKQVFTSLFELSAVERQAVYNEWLCLSRGSMPEDDYKKIDEAAKVDYNNPYQFTVLYQHFRHNMRTIICWLKWSVFPTEGMQYPLKLSANAWNLADNSSILTRGFSGTDDRKLLLPLQVHSQVVQEGRNGGVLRATNGKMLHLLLKHATYEHLDMQMDMRMDVDANADQDDHVKPDAPKKSWRAVLECAQERGCIALIDAGAMMVGASNLEVADCVLETMSLRPAGSLKVKAVLYFNTDLGAGCWEIKDTTRRVWPRYASPIHESECFVLFDESRCIGSDVKMPHSAQCMLTIGTKACKDKVMQAAGRARMLGRGQSLLLLGMSDVTDKIRIANLLTSSMKVETKHVLEWIVENTIAGIKEGLLLWADQGARYCVAHGEDGGDGDSLGVGGWQYALEEEELSLQDMYGAALADEVPVIVQRNCAETQLKRRKGDPLTKDVQSIFDRIGEHCEELGGDYTVRKTNTSGERERELAVEVLQIKQLERQFDKREAVAETDWIFGTVPTHSLATILRSMNATTLVDSITTHVDSSFGLQHIPWPATIFCSTNYTKTVIENGKSGLQDHLRPVGTFLYFPREKTAVLLSEREADGVLRSLQNSEQTATNLRFMHIAYCSGKGASASPLDTQPPSALTTPSCTPSPSPPSSPSSKRPPQLPKSINFDDTLVDPTIVASLQLFNGDTMYAPETKTALQELLSTSDAKMAALRLPDIRGVQFMLSRSDLEDVCG